VVPCTPFSWVVLREDKIVSKISLSNEGKIDIGINRFEEVAWFSHFQIDPPASLLDFNRCFMDFKQGVCFASLSGTLHCLAIPLSIFSACFSIFPLFLLD
jgi:hypothetical protein